jgi:CelD/BcsL family acetyltransferase involved in cellulose biosynthesis
MKDTRETDAIRALVVTEGDTWEGLGPAWSDLFATSAQASPPLDHDWLRTWWQVYGTAYSGAGGALRVLTLWHEDVLVGGLPLYEGAPRGVDFGLRRLRFLSTGEDEAEEVCPDYMNLLCRAGHEAGCAGRAWAALRGLSWDHLELLDIPADSPLITAKPGGAAVRQRGVCPVAELDGGFDAYLGRLSANGRQQARRLVREAERPGIRFELAQVGQVDEFFDDLVRLHQERWTAEGKPGCFAAPRFTEFHRRLAGVWAPDGRAVLARLSDGAGPVAVLYGFVCGSKFDFYQSGVKRDSPGPLRSPGMQGHLLLMRELAARGVTRYDFLRGSAHYKQRLATAEVGLVALDVWRPTFRAAAHASSRLVARAVRRCVRAAWAPAAGRQP